MQRTRLGISVGLLGAALFFAGLIGILPLLLLVGYVLLLEENVWLKRTAIKVAAIVLSFAVVSAILGFGDNLYSVLHALWSLGGGQLSMAWYHDILSILKNIVWVAQTVILLIGGFRALRQGSIPVKPIDRTIGKHI